MTMKNNKDFNDRMSILCPGKAKIVKAILEDDYDLVLDLGAGQCVIGLELAKNGFNGQIISVDNIKTDQLSPEDKKKVHFRIDSIGHFADTFNVDNCGYGPIYRIAIILSAVLHELDIDEFIRLQNFIGELGRKYSVTVFIREPYYDENLLISNALETYVQSMDAFNLDIEPKFKEYLDASKKSWALPGAPLHIQYINYKFLLSYGEDAWEREKCEGRFTFSWAQLSDFINECALSVKYKYYERDSVYSKLDIYNIIRYTSCLIVASNDN